MYSRPTRRIPRYRWIVGLLALVSICAAGRAAERVVLGEEFSNTG